MSLPLPSSPLSPFGARPFTSEETARINPQLSRLLSDEELSSRPGQGGQRFVYLQTQKAITLTNECFGFDGWSSSVQSMTTDYLIEEKNGKFSCAATAIVRVILKSGSWHDGTGVGIMMNAFDRGAALEKAKKEAESDGLKRALRLFGKGLGNTVYDKQYTDWILKGGTGTGAGVGVGVGGGGVARSLDFSSPPPQAKRFKNPPPMISSSPHAVVSIPVVPLPVSVPIVSPPSSIPVSVPIVSPPLIPPPSILPERSPFDDDELDFLFINNNPK